jgi:SHS2 domain-containing protein
MGVAGIGATPEEAFEQAALALTALITDELVVARKAVTIHCRAPSLELLFVDWLNALVYEMATRTMLFGRFKVTIEGTDLAATAWGEPVDRERHQPAVEVKGATLTALEAGPDASGAWRVACVVDV